jgi:hypothetical protein
MTAMMNTLRLSSAKSKYRGHGLITFGASRINPRGTGPWATFPCTVVRGHALRCGSCTPKPLKFAMAPLKQNPRTDSSIPLCAGDAVVLETEVCNRARSTRIGHVSRAQSPQRWLFKGAEDKLRATACHGPIPNSKDLTKEAWLRAT